MNTTTPRARAGKPYLPPMPMRRVQPIDFILPDDDEQAVRNGFDEAMKAPISKPQHVDTASADDEQHTPPDLRWFAWLLISLALTALSFVMGFLAQRFFF